MLVEPGWPICEVIVVVVVVVNVAVVVECYCFLINNYCWSPSTRLPPKTHHFLMTFTKMCNPSTQDGIPAYCVFCCCGLVLLQKPSVFQHFQPGATWYNFMTKSIKTLKTFKNQCFFIILTPLMDGSRCLLEAMTCSKTIKSLQFFNIFKVGRHGIMS